MSTARSGSGTQQDLFEAEATRGLLDTLPTQSRLYWSTEHVRATAKDTAMIPMLLLVRA
jgi:hypothetical protein